MQNHVSRLRKGHCTITLKQRKLETEL